MHDTLTDERQLIIAKLHMRHTPIAPDRPWCFVPGGPLFDGEMLHVGGRRTARKILTEIAVAGKMEDRFVVWTPLKKRQRGRIPRALRCGFTLARTDDDIVVFQSVAFDPHGVHDILARPESGQIIAVAAEKVSAWDGTSLDDGTLLRILT